MVKDFRPLGDPGSDQFQVDAYPFYLLNRTASRYNALIEPVLRPLGVDIPTWRVLMVLGEAEPQPVGQVARTAVINISTMIRIVERMTRAELITSNPSKDDGRVTQLSLTAHGHDKLAAARQATAPIYQKIIHGFSAADFHRLLDLINRLHDNLG